MEQKSSGESSFWSNEEQNMEVTATSRRLHVATSARDLHPSILKYGWLRNRGMGRRTRKGTEFQSRSTETSTKCPGFGPFLIVRYYFG